MRDDSLTRSAWLVLAVSIASCRKEPAPVLEPVAVQRLREHLVSKHRSVFLERLGEEYLWSDRAILERGTKFPKPIQSLLEDSIPDGAIVPGRMGEVLQDVERRRAEWRPATLRRLGTTDLDCEVGDGSATFSVNCVYVNYLETRYPQGRFLVKAPPLDGGTPEPLLFLEGDQVRAALMPVMK